MSRGLGDRWLDGQPIDGVVFGLGDLVAVDGGRADGRQGRVRLLLSPPPDPLYLVELDDGATVRVRQASLAAAT